MPQDRIIMSYNFRNKQEICDARDVFVYYRSHFGVKRVEKNNYTIIWLSGPIFIKPKHKKRSQNVKHNRSTQVIF